MPLLRKIFGWVLRYFRIAGFDSGDQKARLKFNEVPTKWETPKRRCGFLVASVEQNFSGWYEWLVIVSLRVQEAVKFVGKGWSSTS